MAADKSGLCVECSVHCRHGFKGWMCGSTYKHRGNTGVLLLATVSNQAAGDLMVLFLRRFKVPDAVMVVLLLHPEPLPEIGHNISHAMLARGAVANASAWLPLAAEEELMTVSGRFWDLMSDCASRQVVATRDRDMVAAISCLPAPVER